MECAPKASPEVVKVAWADPFNVPVPIVVAPSRNVTVPVATLHVPGPDTVAVNVTGCPTDDGFIEEATETVGVKKGAACSNTFTFPAVTTRSGLPSPFRSAVATALALPPALKFTAG